MYTFTRLRGRDEERRMWIRKPIPKEWDRRCCTRVCPTQVGGLKGTDEWKRLVGMWTKMWRASPQGIPEHNFSSDSNAGGS
jgi:hypothetical protein